ncbi:stage II sporulation protein R [Lachnospiraceae bacterium HCP1S3_A8]
MKRKKELSLSIACFLLSFLCFMAWNQERDKNLAAKICPAVLRLHVIGASNSDQDQQVKLQVKSFVVKQISSWNARSKDELVLEVQNRQTSLADAIRSYAASELGIPLDVKLSVSRTFFPTKSYGDLTFPQGMYDAVEIRLGAGRGRNWWCVLYPELCFPDLTHAVVPEESKEKLTELLGKETYAQLLESQNARLNIQPGILKLLKSLL